MLLSTIHIAVIVTCIRPTLTQHITTQRAAMSTTNRTTNTTTLYTDNLDDLDNLDNLDDSEETATDDALAGQFLTSVRASLMESTTLASETIDEIVSAGFTEYVRAVIAHKMLLILHKHN